MRNIRGHELPFDDHESKQEYYRKNLSPPMPIQKRDEAVILPGKDTTFWDVVVPFCEERGLRKILDVGAAYGRYSAWFAMEGYEIEAMDIASEPLRESLETAGIHIPVLEGDLETVIDDMGNYDMIFMSDVVEHFINWELTMVKVASHCKFCYILIPGDRSWDWTPDHLTIFDDEKITIMSGLFKSVMYYEKVYYDDDNYWHTAIFKGYA